MIEKGWGCGWVDGFDISGKCVEIIRVFRHFCVIRRGFRRFHFTCRNGWNISTYGAFWKARPGRMCPGGAPKISRWGEPRECAPTNDPLRQGRRISGPEGDGTPPGCSRLLARGPVAYALRFIHLRGGGVGMTWSQTVPEGLRKSAGVQACELRANWRSHRICASSSLAPEGGISH